MKVKYAYGITPGISGTGQGAECRIGMIDEKGVAVIVLADPADGAENTGLCTKLETEAAAGLLTEKFDEIYASKENFVETEVMKNIWNAFQGKGIEFCGADGALLFFAVKEKRYLAGHRGSGFIALLNDSCTILSKPEANEQDRTRMKIYKGEQQEPFGVMLINEGACHSLYDSSTGNLSSACGTFFEWLREYDEETVSEALAKNIDQYFLKDGKGDIAVAVMVAEQEDELKEGRKKGKFLRYLAVVFVVLAAIFVCTLIPPQNGTEPKKQENDNAEVMPPAAYAADYEPRVTFSADQPESFDAGVYQVGEDIPAGEYFFWTGEMLKADSVDVNGFTCLSDELYCLTVRVNPGDTLTSEVRFTMAGNVNPIEATKETLISGKYKIGKDIAPGTYRIKPEDEKTQGRYYSIFDDEISNDTAFDRETTVQVPEEGYIVFYNSVLTVQ
ncbi:MAG: hypothetical protein PHC91_01955 [Eubacteriales bacterium]|nr:hypothetical protein [Eubacteriales bacterium]